jgi:hypothetical protein
MLFNGELMNDCQFCFFFVFKLGLREEYNPNQHFIITEDGFICLKKDEDLVLNLIDNQFKKGTEINLSKKKENSKQQKWIFTEQNQKVIKALFVNFGV